MEKDENRSIRLLRIMRDVKTNPDQTVVDLLKKYGISRSQFYKDKDALAELGFSFEYRKASGFRVIEDRLTPINDFSLSDRVILLFALEDLCASHDGLLAARAIEVGRKLASGLESPFREQLLDCFDSEVTESAYGVKPEIFRVLSEAVKNRERIKILYLRSGNWEESWRLVDPKRLYMRLRILYLYARTVDETPAAWKVFRLSRIKEVQATGISFQFNPEEDDGFCERQKNAFFAFIGEKTRSVTIRFTGEAIPYVKEQEWHPGQKLEDQLDGSLLFTVQVAEPMEVVRWSRQFGENATVVSIEE